VNVEKRNKNKKYSTYLEEEIAALLQAADNTPQYIGTFFVVGVAGKHGNTFTHAVTAEHVAENVDGGPFFFGVNFKDDKAGWLRSDLKWWYHPKESNTDVAVTIMAPSERTDMEYIPEAIFAADETIKRDNIGLGDEISVVGLFTNFVGTSKHFPAVRTGNIADKVPMPDGPMEVYLAEGRSIGGLSGSPVFVRPTTRIVGLGNEQGASSGVWHGRVSLSWADAWPLGFASWCSGRASGSGEHGHFHCSSR
jgi:hypothetical protein